ncbi:unnamed protein product [Porites evermanni]|uniref:START domain-containing protein n=1 Tax=Porites evermanni TaxID=104178 RepID=A0ABN8S6J6_9CNID|nr:unnamed protein product [Porites evermanni]
MISVLWLLYLLLVSVLLAFFTYAIFFRKGRLHDSTPAQDKVKYLKKHILPICSTGWKLMAVDSGLRVWQKNVENKPSWMPRTIYACFGIIPASQKEVINILKQPDLMMEWDPAVKNISKVAMATDNDVISVSFNCTSLIARVVHQIRESFGGEINAVYSRHWEVDPSSNSDAWFLSYFVEQVIPAEGTLWSCFLVSSIDNGEDEQLESLVTLVAAPVSPWFASIPTLTASRVAGLQDFFTHYKPDASPNKTCGSQASVTSTSLSSTSDDHAKDLVPRLIAKPSGRRYTGASLSVLDDSQVPGVVSRVDNLLQKLNEVYEGTEGTDGWITVGNVKGVDIMKRPPRAGERPWDCLKGTSVICAPIHYILAYVESLDFRGEWDDLFVKGETVEQYDPITKVARTQFKPVWPASGRDFCNFVVLRELAEGVFCQAYEAVEHENCPEVKDFVRAEIIIGGFVVKELSSDPPSCLVTYITRVDLKGKLPVRLVNKVTSSQPEAVAVLRDKLEALYQADVASNSGEMSEIQKLGVDLWTELMKAKEARLPRAGEAAEREEKESVLEWSLVEKHFEDDVSSSDMDSRREPSNFTDSGEMFPATDENMQLPFLDRHNIDFKTLGSQAAANLLGEVLLASKVEISMSEEMSEMGSSEQEWSYQSIEKDVVILRKISPGEKIHSFLGKGMIKVKPPAVWQAIRNYTTRYMYDKMLKKTRLVRQIDEQTKIIYLHHETTQCFVKQSRDFVMLTSERVEPERYVLAALSVDIPELPPTKDITRGKIFSSGWIIEPVLQNGQLYSMVSYLSQIDFGGALPVRLVNLIARRQPLCIAYLRTYLEKLEDNQSP